MFLSSGLLNEEERDRSFDAIPDFSALLRNRAVADAFVQPVFLGQLDGMIGGFAREAFSAHADSTYLLVRGRWPGRGVPSGGDLLRATRS